MKKLYYGKVISGKIKLDKEKEVKLLLKALEGKEIEVTVSPRVKERSIQFNKFYWKVIVDHICKVTGNDKDVVHKYLKKKYLSKLIDTSENGDLIVLDSTRKLSSSQFVEYIQNIIAGESSYGFPLLDEVEI